MTDGTSPVPGDRALSQAGVAALAFGLTVAMIAGVGILLVQTSGSMGGGGPIISVSADPVDASNGLCCQRVRIYHESGETVPLADLELVVSVPEHDKQGRLHDLPTSVLDQGDYTGNHVFTLGDVGIGGVADADADTDGNYNAGDVIEFRIAHQRVDLQPGDHVVVSLRDGESDEELASVNVTVVGS